MKTVSYSEFARMRGVSQPYISKLVKQKIIKKTSLVKERYRFKIIVERAERDLERHAEQKSKKENLVKKLTQLKISTRAKHPRGIPASDFMPDPELDKFFADTSAIDALFKNDKPPDLERSSLPKLKSLHAVAGYLRGEGWKVSPPTIYKHRASGYIRPDKGGGYSVKTALKYAYNHLNRLSGEVGTVGPDQVTIEKREAEVRKLAAQARHWEAKADIAEGGYIKITEFERALAQRAMIFRSDCESFIRTYSSEMVRLVEGDALKIPDLIDFWLERLEKWLARYSRGAHLK